MGLRDHLTKPAVVSVVVVGLLAVTGGFAGAAQLTSRPKSVFVCVNGKNQVVSLTAKGKCPKRTKSVSVSTSGVVGPKGARGVPGKNGTNGKDGAAGPGALATTLDNASSGDEPSGIQQITGTDLYFDVDCQPDVMAYFSIKDLHGKELSAHGTAYLDPAGSPTLFLGHEAGSTTTGTTSVNYDTATDTAGYAAVGTSAPSSLLRISGSSISGSANLIVEEGYTPTSTSTVFSVVFTATVTPTECFAQAQVVPSE